MSEADGHEPKKDGHVIPWTPEQVRLMETPIREFESGATRDTDEGKLDYEAFLSPLVLREYAKYMHANRLQKNGELRDGDNWQKGIPLEAYMKSGFRHFVTWWEEHRRGEASRDNTEPLCALLFNVMGYLHVLLSDRE